jgi:hypothetical protein
MDTTIQRLHGNGEPGSTSGAEPSGATDAMRDALSSDSAERMQSTLPSEELASIS